MAEARLRLEPPILLDNTVLSNLALVGEVGLVQQLWPRQACTTPQVLDEYNQGAESGLVPAGAWSDLAVLIPTASEVAFAAGLSSALGPGERSCLAVAARRQGLLVSDDLDARQAAQSLGVPRSGTVGILILAVRRGFLSRERANALLSEMRELGYRSPVDDLDSLLEGP